MAFARQLCAQCEVDRVIIGIANKVNNFSESAMQVQTIIFVNRTRCSFVILMPRNLRSSATKRIAEVPKPRYWSEAEHERFLLGLQIYGKREQERIAQVVGTKTKIQVRTHAQKYFLRLAKADRLARETTPDPIPTLENPDTSASQHFYSESSQSDSVCGDLFPEVLYFLSAPPAEDLLGDAENESETTELLLSPIKAFPL